jgi:short coiled-coil protein
MRIPPNDVRAMSPRRTSEDLENMGKEARDEIRK